MKSMGGAQYEMELGLSASIVSVVFVLEAAVCT